MKAPIRTWLRVALLSSTLLPMHLTACATQGTVTGDIHNPGQAGGKPILMRWHSDGASVNQGQMTTILPSGEVFTGPYLQVTKQTTQTNYAPMWDGWDEGWGGWGPYGGYSGDAGVSFGTIYSGRVIANLEGDRGDRIRCRFMLAVPSAGMAGGGQGQCQTSTHKTIDAIIHSD